MASLLTRASDAFGRAYRNAQGIDAPGDAIKVSPFERGTVTPGAVALKSLAALIAGRRSAANTKLKMQQTASANAYRDLQMKNLESQIAERGKPKQPAPVQRMVPPPEDGFDVSTLPTYDANTGSVEAPTYLAHRLSRALDLRKREHADLQRQRGEVNQRLADRANATKHYTQAQSALRNLDAEAAAEGDRWATNIQAEGERLLGVLTSPTRTPAEKAEAARNLRIGPAVGPGGTPLIDPATKSPLYDPKEAADSIKRYVEMMRARGVARAKASQASRRAAFQRVTASEAGVIGQDAGTEGDPLDDVRALIELYGGAGPTSAAGDTSWYDLPAR